MPGAAQGKGVAATGVFCSADVSLRGRSPTSDGLGCWRPVEFTEPDASSTADRRGQYASAQGYAKSIRAGDWALPGDNGRRGAMPAPEPRSGERAQAA